MNRNLKVCLIIAGALIFLAGLVVVGSVSILYLNRDKLAEGIQDWTEDVKGRAQEGEAFGASTDQKGCLDEALLRTEGKGSFGAVAPSLFLAGCLNAAAPTEGFCEGSPPAGEILATVAWTRQRCAEVDRPNDQGCLHLMQAVQRLCNDGPEE